MSLHNRDRAVIVVLTLALVLLGGALAIPNSTPAASTAPGASGQPDESLAPVEPVVYREGVVGVPESITPVSARSRSERTLVGLIFSGLVQLGPDNTLRADLAQSWRVDDDGKTWTFQIRDDATWQDGEPVTAADVVFTLSVLQDPDANGPAAASWAAVTAVATGDKTVVMTLDAPVSGFVAAATQPILPAHLLAGQPLADIPTGDFSRNPIGTGPYTLVDINDQRAILVPTAALEAPATTEDPASSPSVDPFDTPSPGESPAPPGSALDEIEIDFFPDDAAAADAFRSGAIDGVAGLAPDVQTSVETLPGVERIVYPTTTLSTVMLNLRTDHAELADVRTRKALLGAIDRDAIIADVMGGDARSADTLIPPAWSFYDEKAVKPVKYDLKASAKLLKDAGWKKVDGKWQAPGTKKPYQLELLTVPADANPRLAAVGAHVRDAWTKLGMTVDLVEVPAADLAERLGAGDFTATVLDVTLGLEPDLYPLLASSQVRASGSNVSGYQDPKLDALLEAARAQGTHDERVKAWTALLTALNDRLPMLPLAWVDDVVLARGLQGATTRLIVGPGDRFWDVLAWRLAADR
jgi:peptide/nickel transport system substrate-binding protein